MLAAADPRRGNKPRGRGRPAEPRERRGRRAVPLEDVPQEALVRQRRARDWAGAGAGARAVRVGGHGPRRAAGLGRARRHWKGRGGSASASAGGGARRSRHFRKRRKCVAPRRSRGPAQPIPSRVSCPATPESSRPAACPASRACAAGRLLVRVPLPSAEQSGRDGRKGRHSGTFNSCVLTKSWKRMWPRKERLRDSLALLWISQPRFLSQATCALCPGLTCGSPCLWARDPIMLPARVSSSAGDSYRPHLDTDDATQRF